MNEEHHSQQSQQFHFPIEGMTCASCVGRVERALKKLPQVNTAEVNLANETAYVTGSAELTLNDLIQTVKKTVQSVLLLMFQLRKRLKKCVVNSRQM